MGQKIVTRNMLRSFGGAMIAFLIAVYPIFFAYFSHATTDQMSTVKHTGSSGAEEYIYILGIIELKIRTLVYIHKESLLSALALGVGVGLTWWEASSDSQKLGLWAGIYSFLGIAGAVCSMAVFTIVGNANVNTDNLNPEYSTLMKSSVVLLLGICIFYFMGICQIRRRLDIIGG